MKQYNVFLFSIDETSGDTREDGEAVLSLAEERLAEIDQGDMDVYFSPDTVRGLVAYFADGRRYERPDENASGHEKLATAAEWCRSDPSFFQHGRGIAIDRFASCFDVQAKTNEELYAAILAELNKQAAISPDFCAAGRDIRRNTEAQNRHDRIKALGMALALLHESDNPPFVNAQAFIQNTDLPCDIRELEMRGGSAMPVIVIMEYDF